MDEWMEAHVRNNYYITYSRIPTCTHVSEVIYTCMRELMRELNPGPSHI